MPIVNPDEGRILGQFAFGFSSGGCGGYLFGGYSLDLVDIFLMFMLSLLLLEGKKCDTEGGKNDSIFIFDTVNGLYDYIDRLLVINRK